MGTRSGALSGQQSGQALLGLLLLAVCVLVAGSGAAVTLSLERDGSPSAEQRTESRQHRQGEPERGGSESEAPDDDARAGRWQLPSRLLALVVLVLLLAVAAFLIGRLRLSLRRRAGRAAVRPALPTPDGGELDDDPAEATDDLEELTEALDAGLLDLSDGDPRNAIVAAWLRLETACSSERFVPDPADTPTEFVRRALASYALDEAAITELVGLYREARFSTHPITEAQREAAARCLTVLLSGLSGLSGPARLPITEGQR